MSKDELNSRCCLPHILVRAGGSGCVLSHELHLYWITWKPHVSSSVWMSTGPSKSIKTRSPVQHKNKAAGSFQRSRGKLSCSFCLCLCLRGPYVITGALSDSSTHTLHINFVIISSLASPRYSEWCPVVRGRSWKRAPSWEFGLIDSIWEKCPVLLQQLLRHRSVWQTHKTLVSKHQEKHQDNIRLSSEIINLCFCYYVDSNQCKPKQWFHVGGELNYLLRMYPKNWRMTKKKLFTHWHIVCQINLQGFEFVVPNIGTNMF